MVLQYLMGGGGPAMGSPPIMPQGGGMAQFLSNPLVRDFALSMLAQSGPSREPRGIGSIIGTAGLSALQNQELRRERQEDREFKRQQIASAGQPKAGATRKVPMPNNRVQEQIFQNGQWQNFGEPYDRRDPFKQVTTVTPQGVEIGFVDTRTLGGQAQPAGQPPGGSASPPVAEGSAPGPEIISMGRSKQFTDAQSKAATFARRMFKAEDIMTGLEEGGFNPGNLSDVAKSNLPGGNYLVSDEFQSARAAQDDWIRAKLRKESGAVITPEEMEGERRTYFPMPGDRPDVIAQKRRAREVATQNLVAESQGAFESLLEQDQGPGASGEPTRITNDDEYNALPSGARYVGPDGVERVKP